LSDSHAILEKHSEFEKAYIEENVVDSPLVLKSDTKEFLGNAEVS